MLNLRTPEALAQPPVLPASLCAPSAPLGHQPQAPTCALLPSKSISLAINPLHPSELSFNATLQNRVSAMKSTLIAPTGGRRRRELGEGKGIGIC